MAYGVSYVAHLFHGETMPGAKSNPDGRPTKLNKKLGREICERLMKGETLTSICDNDDRMPSLSTVHRWRTLQADGHGKRARLYRWFRDEYSRARLIQQERWGWEAQDIAADDSKDFYLKTGDGFQSMEPNHAAVQRSKLRVDTNMKLLAMSLGSNWPGLKNIEQGKDYVPVINFVEVAPDDETESTG